MSLIKVNRWSADSPMPAAYFFCILSSFVSEMRSDIPTIAFMGVRISCDITAKKSDFARLACCALTAKFHISDALFSRSFCASMRAISRSLSSVTSLTRIMRVPSTRSDIVMVSQRPSAIGMAIGSAFAFCQPSITSSKTSYSSTFRNDFLRRALRIKLPKAAPSFKSSIKSGNKFMKGVLKKTSSSRVSNRA